MNNFAVKSTKRGKNLWSVYGEKAITQIKDRRYAEYLKNEGRADILLYGISFCKKRYTAVVEELK